MRTLAIVAVGIVSALAGAVAAYRPGAAHASPAPLSPLGQNALYDGPVARCPSKPGDTGGVIITTCEGQLCWEGDQWICHLTPNDRPEVKARVAAERQAAAYAHKTAVDAEVRLLGGEYRRAEAERLVTMREQADAARRRAQPGSPPLATVNGVAPRPAAPEPPQMCTLPTSTHTMTSNYWETKALAAADVRKHLTNACSGSNYSRINGTMAGPIECRTLPSVTYANGKREPSTECQVRYSCPAYQAPCPGKSGGKVSGATKR